GRPPVAVAEALGRGRPPRGEDRAAEQIDPEPVAGLDQFPVVVRPGRPAVVMQVRVAVDDPTGTPGVGRRPGGGPAGPDPRAGPAAEPISRDRRETGGA